MPAIEPIDGLAAGVRCSLRAAVEADRHLTLGEPVAGVDRPLPQPGELVAQRQLAAKAVSILEFHKEGRLLASLPVAIETRVVRGLPLKLLVGVGDDFFDYLPLSVQDGVAFSELQPALRATLTEFGVDALLMSHLLPPLPSGCAQWETTFSNRRFIVSAAEDGWAALTRKDSLRRHRNRARKTLEYRVEHVCGRLPDSVLTQIAALHRERWAFDGIRSQFEDPARPSYYTACAERMLTTLVHDGEVLFAAHVGLRFGDTLIWHTPVINLRYLAYSPLEVLLLETLEECARRSVGVVDFGLGDEAYKARFSNSLRPVVNLLYPASLRGWAAHALMRLNILGRLRKRALLWRNWLRGLRSTASGTWLAAPQGGKAPGGAVVAEAAETITDFSRLVDVFRGAGWPLRREHYERMRQGQTFVCQDAGGASPVGVWCQTGKEFSFDRVRTFGDATTVAHDAQGGAAANQADLVSRLASASPAAVADGRWWVYLRADETALQAALKENGWSDTAS